MRQIRSIFLSCLVLWLCQICPYGPPAPVVQAWEWSDLVSSGDAVAAGSSSEALEAALSMDQVASMRVRDIKRRLARQHGYSADEVGRMIDKKELIEALAYEEEKVRLKALEALQRTVLQRGILWALVAIAVVVCWPLLQQAKEVAVVNWQVYTDRKSHEAKRCWELKSLTSLLGVLLMWVLDVLQLWLTASMLLSWFISRNKYFFPVPNISIRPAQLLGGEAEKNFGGYGINVGTMAVGWVLRFLHARVETWTGRAMLAAQKKLRPPKSGKTTKTKKSKTKVTAPPSTMPDEWMEPAAQETPQSRQQQQQQQQQDPPPVSSFPESHAPKPVPPTSHQHFDFLNQLDENNNQDDNGWNVNNDEIPTESLMDELD